MAEKKKMLVAMTFVNSKKTSTRFATQCTALTNETYFDKTI